jgi:hypothetical protein
MVNPIEERQMHTAQHTPVTRLAGGQLLRVADGTGHGVAVFEGLVWITQSGDERDVFLQPGETFHFDRDGIALVEALRRRGYDGERLEAILRGNLRRVLAAALPSA